jgi:hypothetical protein
VNRRRDLAAQLPVWIAGDGRASLMSPAEATDLALGDQRLAGWIRSVWRDRGNTFLEFDRRTGAWWIGLALPREGRDFAEGRVAIVDAATGQILGVFDMAVDGRGTATIIGPVP